MSGFLLPIEINSKENISYPTPTRGEISVAWPNGILQNRTMPNVMSLRFKLFVFFTLLFLIFAIDQATKNWAVHHLLGQGPTVYWGGLFQFTYAENAGAFLGLGGELSQTLRFVIFAVVVLGGLIAMLWYLIKKEKSKLNFFAYSFILAGGFGNLWDRMVHDRGHVVDFMMIDIWGPLRTGVFNVADMAIVAGVLLALFGEYVFDGRSPKKAKIANSNP